MCVCVHAGVCFDIPGRQLGVNATLVLSTYEKQLQVRGGKGAMESKNNKHKSCLQIFAECFRNHSFLLFATVLH